MRYGHHKDKEAAEVAKANREPKATPFPPAEAWSLPVLCAFCVQHFVAAWTCKLLSADFHKERVEFGPRDFHK